MTPDFVDRPAPEPWSNRTLRRRRERTTRVRVGVIRQCNCCGVEYQPEHAGAFFGTSCFETLRWQP